MLGEPRRDIGFVELGGVEEEGEGVAIAVMLAGAEMFEEEAAEGMGDLIVGIEAIIKAIAAVISSERDEGNGAPQGAVGVGELGLGGGAAEVAGAA